MRKILGLIAVWGPAAALGLLGNTAAEAQTWRTMTSARQVWDTAPMEVNIRYGAGTLTVGTAESPMLYELEIRYDEEAFTPLAEYDEDDRQLRLGVESTGRDGRSLNVREGSTATIRLSRQVPMDLDLEFGAGKAEIELGGVPLQRLELSTGASETVVSFREPNPIRAEEIIIEAGAADLQVLGLGNTRASEIEFHGGVGATVLDFGGDWQGSATASVEMGIGSVTLRLPRTHGIRLDRSSFLTSFTAPGLERRGESYFSANWGETADQLTIDVSAALGSIEIDWID